MAAFSFVNFSFRYAGASEEALRNLTLTIREGEFVLLCGKSGSGKTTLLRLMKPEIAPVGTVSGFRGRRAPGRRQYRRGKHLFFGKRHFCLGAAPSAVGFVMQDPDNQIVTDTVGHELAFGLENLCMPPAVIRRRVAETAHFFGIGGDLSRRTDALSGGQKQLLSLAAVTAMRPQMLLLDEPTAQLDPAAAENFLALLQRLNRETGMTVVLSVHDLEEVLPIADRVLFLEGGALRADLPPRAFAASLRGDAFAAALPAASQLPTLPDELPPITVREGRAYLQASCGEWLRRPDPAENSPAEKSPGVQEALLVRDVWYRYTPESDFALRGLDLSVRKGEIHAVLGGNGSGKSTLLRLLSGTERPSRGKIRIQKGLRTALLPQSPKMLFGQETLLRDLMELSGQFSYSEKEMREMAETLGILPLLSRHPYDLSGGELQRAALAKLLLTRPEILLLDEPSKGIDACSKAALGGLLRAQRDAGRTVLLVTHDLPFAAALADRCTMLFAGSAVSTAEGRAFFCGNAVYTTGTNRITRGLLPGCVLPEDVVRK